MRKVSIEVRSEATRFRVAIQAEGIQRASWASRTTTMRLGEVRTSKEAGGVNGMVERKEVTIKQIDETQFGQPVHNQTKGKRVQKARKDKDNADT